MSVALRNALFLVAGVLLAALIAPSLIDWNRYKPLIEAKIEEALGRDVTLGGTLDFTLLPQPKLFVGDLAIGNAKGATAPELFRVRMMEARVALLPLFIGRVRFDGIRLIEPVLSLERLSDGTLNWHGIPKARAAKRPQTLAGLAPRIGLWLVGSDAVSIRAVQIERGRFAHIDHKEGFEERLAPIDGSLAADTLQGPYRARANVGFRNAFFVLSLNLGKRASEGPRTVEASLALPSRALKATLIGRIEGGILGGALIVHADNPPALWQSRPLAKDKGTKSVTLEGALTASREALFLRDIGIRWGAFRGAGEADAHFDQEPRVALALSGGALDLDAMLPAREARNVEGEAPWPLVLLGLDLRGQGGKAPAAANGPSARGVFDLWRGTLSLGLGKLVLKGGTIGNLRSEAELAPGKIEHLSLRASLPGEAALLLAGRLRSDTRGSLFEGEAALEGKSARTLLAWLDVPVHTVSAKRLLGFAYRGGVELGPGRIALTDFAGKLDGGQAKGTLRLAVDDRIEFDADLHASRLNLDAYRPLWLAVTAQGGARETRPLFDGLFALLARANGRLALTADSFVYLGAELRDVTATATVKEARLALDGFSAANVGGGRLALQGEIGNLVTAPQVALEARLDAPDGASALRALGLPLRARSASPTPLTLVMAANGPRVAVKLLPVRLTLGAQILEGEGSFDFAHVQPRLDLRVKGGALDLSPLLDGEVPPSAPAIWAEERLALEGLGDLDGTLAFEAEKLSLLGIVLDAPRFDATLESGALDIRDMRGGLLGGRFAANAIVRGGAALPGFGLSFKFADIEAAPMTELLWDWPVLAGRLDGTLSLASQGESELALARALTGQFSVAAQGGTLSGFDLAAFHARLRQAGAAEALAPLERGKTPFSSLNIVSEIGGGRLVLREGLIALEDGTAHLEGGADIATRQLAARLEVPAPSELNAPPAVICFEGPLAAPAVSRDLSALAAYLGRRTASAEPQPSAETR